MNKARETMHRIGLELIELRRKDLLTEQSEKSKSKLSSSIDSDDIDMYSTQGRDLLTVLSKCLIVPLRNIVQNS